MRVSRQSDDIYALASNVHDVMTGEGWDHHESGSGDWYQKKIGDKVHVIVRQPGGWIHNSGPSAEEMGENPTWHDDISTALMKAHRGKDQAGFRAVPPGMSRMNSVHEATQNEEVDSYGSTEITPEERDLMKEVR